MKHAVEITDQSAIAEARRLARTTADRLDLPETRVEEVAIVASEAATNLLKHAGGGRLMIQVMPSCGGPRLCIAATDTGPGIEDLEEALRDGVSTVGSAGSGLGAMRRLSDRFDLRSRPGEGTVVLCEFATGDRRLAGVDLGVFLMNYPGETACGDGWAARNREGTFELLLADGLGHGVRAEAAAAEAIEAFRASTQRDPGVALAAISEQLVGTRGSVAGLLQIEAADRRLRFAGLGNISALIASPSGEITRLVSRDGRVGGPGRQITPEDRELKPGEAVILHSDGIASLRESDGLRELLRHDAATIAATLMRDLFRGRDDASVAVARIGAEAG